MMDRLEDLIMRWEEDELSEAEVEELVALLQDPNNRWKFHEHMQTSQTLTSFFQTESKPAVSTVESPAEPAPKQKAKPKRRLRTSSVHNVAYRTRQMKAVRSRSSKRILYMASAAAAAVLVVIALVSAKLMSTGSGSGQGPSVATISSSEGEVTIFRAGTGRQSGPGVQLYVGDFIVAAGGKAKLKLNDGTLVTVNRHAQLTIASAGGNADTMFRVERGRIDFNVRKQYRGKKLVVTGPHSQATVLGTQFSFDVSVASTRLDVYRGRVRYENISGGVVVGSLILTAGRHAIAGDGIRFELLPRREEPVNPPDPKRKTEVTGFTLINAVTDRAIRLLHDGDTVSLSKDGRSLNVRADTAGTVGSVQFYLDGKRQTAGEGRHGSENFAPFSMKGDKTGTGDYNPWNPALGTYTIRAVPYKEMNGLGLRGTEKQITIKVVR